MLTECSITGDVDVEALVACAEGDTHCHVRSRIAEVGLVVVINDAIAVDVNKLQVAHLQA